MKLTFGRNNALPIEAQVQVYEGTHELARGAARYVMAAIEQTLVDQGRFSLVLSGGSTPEAVYTLLGQPPMVDQVRWSGVHFFWGDERCVPPEHAESNFKMALETLLTGLSLPSKNIHRIQGEIPAEEAAAAYEREIAEFFKKKNKPPHFDLVLLGMGEDGHTASLFPDSPALEEKQRWVMAVEHARPPAPLVNRITMTFPLINAARRVAVIVTGASKAEIVQQALSGAGSFVLPVQRVNPEEGELVWFLDGAAAEKYQVNL